MHSSPVGALFPSPETREQWEAYELTDEQLAFYRENGYVGGVRVLPDEQVETLCEELAAFFEPEHSGRELWYEYHTNESADTDTVLFHALGGVENYTGLSRFAVESGDHRASRPVDRRPRPLLARPVVLQAGQARRRGGVASGLFVLDANSANGTPDLLGWIG